MRDLLENVWVKRCVSVFAGAYAAVIALFTYATFLYDLVFVDGKQGTFLVIYTVASIVFLALMIYTREVLFTRILSVLLLPIVFFLLLFNISNGNWVLIIPAFVTAIVIFFAAGTRETVKVIMGTIYLLLYVLGIVAYIVCQTLFSETKGETVLDMSLDPASGVYSYYKEDLSHLAQVIDEKNTISPDGKYRFYLTDVKDSDRGCVRIYVVPNGEDNHMKFFSLNQKGIKKRITTKGTRGVVPDVGWTLMDDGNGGQELGLAYHLTPQDNWKFSSVTGMPKKNYLEFLGITL